MDREKGLLGQASTRLCDLIVFSMEIIAHFEAVVVHNATFVQLEPCESAGDPSNTLLTYPAVIESPMNSNASLEGLYAVSFAAYVYRQSNVRHAMHYRTYRIDLDRRQLKTAGCLALRDHVEDNRRGGMFGVDETESRHIERIRPSCQIESNPLARSTEARGDGNRRGRVLRSHVNCQSLRCLGERKLEAGTRPGEGYIMRRILFSGRRLTYHHVEGAESHLPW